MPVYLKVFLAVLQIVPRCLQHEASPSVEKVALGLNECFYWCSAVRVLHWVPVPQREQTMPVTTLPISSCLAGVVHTSCLQRGSSC